MEGSVLAALFREDGGTIRARVQVCTSADREGVRFGPREHSGWNREPSPATDTSLPKNYSPRGCERATSNKPKMAEYVFRIGDVVS